MGCASSNPLVEGGKNLVTTAKDSVNDVVAKGEHTLHEAGDVAKEGMEHVKEAVESAMTTVENSIGNVVGKVSNTFNSTKNDAVDAIDAVEQHVEDATNKASEGVTEVVSEAETVVVSEVESNKEKVSITATKTFKKIDSLTDEFGEAITETKEEVADSLHIEDIEQSIDTIDTNYKDMKKKAEDLVNGLSTPSPPPDAEHEDKKEEPAPTFWEAAADAILEQRIRPSLDIADTSDVETEAGSEPETNRPNSAGSDTQSDAFDSETEPYDHEDTEKFKEDLFQKPKPKERIPPPEIIINSESLSVKSYRSDT